MTMRLFKLDEDIHINPVIGDIVEIESGIFIRVLEIFKETEEDFFDIKKSKTHLRGEVISNYTLV